MRILILISFLCLSSLGFAQEKPSTEEQIKAQINTKWPVPASKLSLPKDLPDLRQDKTKELQKIEKELRPGGGTVIGSGGNSYELEFNGYVNEVIASWLSAEIEKIGSLKLADLLEMKSHLGTSIRVEIGDLQPVQMGLGTRDAVSVISQGLIYIQKERWLSSGREARKKLAIHELLVIHGNAEIDTEGKLSNLIVDAPASIRDFLDFSTYLDGSVRRRKELCQTALLGIISFVQLGGSVNQSNIHGKTFMHELAFQGCDKEISALLRIFPEVNINAQLSDHGYTVLAQAMASQTISEEHYNIIALLLKAGADTRTQQFYFAPDHSRKDNALMNASFFAGAIAKTIKELHSTDPKIYSEAQIHLRERIADLFRD